MSFRKRSGWKYGDFPTGQFKLNKNSQQARGLIGWWPMQQVHDSSNYRRDIILVGNTDFIASTNGIVLDGQGDTDGSHYAYAPDEDDWTFTTNGNSISCWVKRVNTSQTDGLLDRLQVASTEWVFGFGWYGSQNRLYFWLYGDSGGYVGRYASNSQTSAGIWHHVVITYSGGTTNAAVRLFVDSIQRDDTDFSADTFGTAPRASTNLLNIARNTGGLGKGLTGQMRDVRFYNRELSATEILQLYAPQTRWELYQPVFPRFVLAVPEVGVGDLTISVSDTIALSETVTATVSAPQVSVSDSISLADAPTTRLQSFISVSDNIALSDNAAATLVNLISVLDTISLSDNAAARLQSFITALDTIALSDNAQALIESYITALDTITLADAPTVSVIDAGAIAINVTDTIALSETVTVAISDPQVSVLDTIAISDAPTVVVGVLGDLTILTIDTIAISDSVDVDALIEIDVSPLNEFYLVKGVAIV